MRDTVGTVVVAKPATIQLGRTALKETSLTAGQVETSKSIWEAAGTEVGFWECSPGRFTASREGYAEICQVLTGRATLTDSAGNSVTVCAGDTLITPEGWQGVWDVHTTIRKLYVIVR